MTDSKGPIFVVGAPRTGTTLTMEILNRHPEILLYDEVHYNEKIVDVVGGGNDSALDADKIKRSIDILTKNSSWNVESDDEGAKSILMKEFVQNEVYHSDILKFFLKSHADEQKKAIWGDSSPQDVLYMDTLKAWYPNAKFIGVVRDPRAFLSSYKNYYKKNVKTYRNRYNPVTNSILWRSYMSSLDDAVNGDFSDSVLLLHYEKLVSNPGQEIKKVMDFLGLDFFEEMLNVSRQNSSYFSVKEDFKQSGVSAGSVEKWRDELSNVELWILNSICGGTMEKLGYECERVHLEFGDSKEILQLGAQFPKRLFNILFRTGKPFTKEKLKRVTRSFRKN